MQGEQQQQTDHAIVSGERANTPARRFAHWSVPNGCVPKGGNLLPALACVLLAACGGSSDGDGDRPFTPPTGFPLADGAAVVTAQSRNYSLFEETQVEARLGAQNSVAEPGAPLAVTAVDLAVSFFITQEPRSGSVELDADTGLFTYTPDVDFFGLDSFRYYVILDGAGSEQATINLNVTNINDPPVLQVELDRVVEQGSNYSTVLDGRDPDQDNLVYGAQNLPAWLSLNSNTGLLRGVPEQSDVGIYRDILFSVRDPSGIEALAGPFALEVLDINDPPVINPAQFPSSLDAGESVVVNLFPDDPDGDFVTLEAELNDFADVEILGGSLTLTARPATDVTNINLVVIAKDLLGSSSREIIPITINPVTPSGKGRTLHGRGSGWGVHLVIMSEGYKEDESNTFNDDVANLISLMQQDPAIATHFDAWNIHSVMQPSVDSGIDDNIAEDFRDTAFDTGYFCRNIQRLICANDSRVFDVALNEYPHLDQIVLLVNDNRYGGSGGAIAIASSAAPEIALHELGHSIAGLADEYVDSLIPKSITNPYFEGRYANISELEDPERVPWAHWIDDPDDYPTLAGLAGVGIFEGGFYQESDFFRPTSNSRMRENLALFGPVNGEQWALAVYQRSNPIVDFSPVTRTLTIDELESQVFSVRPSFAEDVQLVSWFIDDEEVVSARGQTELTVELETGEYDVVLVVEDISGRIRMDSREVSNFRWEWKLKVVNL